MYRALCTLVCLLWLLPVSADGPRYKPSSRSPQPIDITQNTYGFSRNAPNALQIGDAAPLFKVPRAGGGVVSLAESLKQGDVVLVFYRGHW